MEWQMNSFGILEITFDSNAQLLPLNLKENIYKLVLIEQKIEDSQMYVFSKLQKTVVTKGKR